MNALKFLIYGTLFLMFLTYVGLYLRVYNEAEDIALPARIKIVTGDIFGLIYQPFQTTAYDDVIKAKQTINKLLEFSNSMLKDDFSNDLQVVFDFNIPNNEQTKNEENEQLKSALTFQLSSSNNSTIPRNINENMEGIRVRYYAPKKRVNNTPAIVYLHGGGWTVGTIESYDMVCRAIASSSNYPVFSIDYRTAPEHRYPTAPNDVYFASKWIRDHAELFSIDSTKLAVSGDSAGGNLAAVVCLMSANDDHDRDRDQKEGKLFAYQFLIYPATDFQNWDLESQLLMGAKNYIIGKNAMLWFTTQYVVHEHEKKDWKVAPLFAPHHLLPSLPPATVILAKYDPLFTEGELYAQKLQNAGVNVQVSVYKTVHGFISEVNQMQESMDLIHQISTTLHSFFDS